MQSSNIPYLSRIDALRFVAAAMVLLFHALIAQLPQVDAFNPLLLWIKEGARGVNLFFVLSGFLFALIAGQQAQIPYRAFMLNRCLRILPLVVFVFFVTASIYRESWHSYDLLGLLFLQFYLEEFRSLSPLGTTWTISIEFMFYLLFPFLHGFTNRYGERYLLALVLLFMVMRVLVYPLMKNEFSYFFSMLGRFDFLLIGMLSGRCYRARPKFGADYYALPLVAVLITVYLFVINDLPHNLLYQVVHPPLEAILWSLLVCTVLNSRLRLPRVERLLAGLGSVSFSMYLLHPFILLNCQSLQLLDDAWSNALLVSCGIAMPLTIALSYLTFYTIEQPFLSLRKTYIVSPLQ